MPVFDLECVVSFGRALEDGERRAFDQAAGVSHPGWHGPQTVVRWNGPQAATVFLVSRGNGADTGAREAVSREAEERIRIWATQAGVAGEALTVNVEATPRP